MALTLPYPDTALLIRTDFSDDQAWHEICAAARAPSPEGFRAGLECIDDERRRGQNRPGAGFNRRRVPGPAGCGTSGSPGPARSTPAAAPPPPAPPRSAPHRCPRAAGRPPRRSGAAPIRRPPGRHTRSSGRCCRCGRTAAAELGREVPVPTDQPIGVGSRAGSSAIQESGRGHRLQIVGPAPPRPRRRDPPRPRRTAASAALVSRPFHPVHQATSATVAGPNRASQARTRSARATAGSTAGIPAGNQASIGAHSYWAPVHDPVVRPRTIKPSASHQVQHPGVDGRRPAIGLARCVGDLGAQPRLRGGQRGRGRPAAVPQDRMHRPLDVGQPRLRRVHHAGQNLDQRRAQPRGHRVGRGPLHHGQPGRPARRTSCGACRACGRGIAGHTGPP